MTYKKGIVVERSDDGAIILMTTGEYRKIHTRKYLEVGDLYEVSGGGLSKYIAVAVIMLALIIGSIDYYSIQAYASLASNVELGVNRWGRVISVQAKDSEGQLLLDTVKVKNDKLEVAVAKISHQVMVEKKNSTDSIRNSLNVVTKDSKNQNLEKDMLERMNKGLENASPQKNQDLTDSHTFNNQMQTEDKNNSSVNDKRIFKLDKSQSKQNTGQPNNKKDKSYDKNDQPESKQNSSHSGKLKDN